jgi:hypothetical protein
MLSSFHRVRSFASTATRLPEAILDPNIDEIAVITQALINCDKASGIGLDKLAELHNLEFEEINNETDLADLIETGLIELKPTYPELCIDSNISTWFGVYALNSLVDFEKYFLESGRTPKERIKKKESNTSHQSIVNASGSLFSALLGLEKCTRYFTKAVGEIEAQRIEAEVISKNCTRAADIRHKESHERKIQTINMMKSKIWQSKAAFSRAFKTEYLAIFPKASELNAEPFILKTVRAHLKDHPEDSVFFKNS